MALKLTDNGLLLTTTQDEVAALLQDAETEHLHFDLRELLEQMREGEDIAVDLLIKASK